MQEIALRAAGCSLATLCAVVERRPSFRLREPSGEVTAARGASCGGRWPRRRCPTCSGSSEAPEDARAAAAAAACAEPDDGGDGDGGGGAAWPDTVDAAPPGPDGRGTRPAPRQPLAAAELQSALTWDDVEQRWGARSVVAVASARLRELLLAGSGAAHLGQLADLTYCILERIGRSRWRGERQTALAVACRLQPRVLFYHVRRRARS